MTQERERERVHCFFPELLSLWMVTMMRTSLQQKCQAWMVLRRKGTRTRYKCCELHVLLYYKLFAFVRVCESLLNAKQIKRKCDARVRAWFKFRWRRRKKVHFIACKWIENCTKCICSSRGIHDIVEICINISPSRHWFRIQFRSFSIPSTFSRTHTHAHVLCIECIQLQSVWIYLHGTLKSRIWHS